MKALFLNKDVHKHALVFLSLFLLILTIGILLRNLNYSYLWFDESGQFWIAKGLNHDSEPLSKPGSLIDVINNNKHFNMDPGGYGIALHYWAYVSNHHIWLRLLSFLFFILTIFVFYWYIYKNVLNQGIALFISFIPFFFPILVNMGFEIRAYSMEALGTLLLIYGLYKIDQNSKPKNLLLWSIVFAFFMCSRYSAIINTFVGFTYVAILIFKEHSYKKEKAIKLLSFGIPLLFSLVYIYLFAFRFQNSDLKQLSYLQYLNANPFVIFKPLNLLYIGSIVLYTILFFYRNKFELIQKHESLLYLCIGANLLFVVLSLLGLHPWRIGAKGNISMVLLNLVCVSAFLAESIKKLFESKPLIQYPFLIIIAFWIFTQRNSSLYPKHGDSTYPTHDLNSNAHFHFNKINLSNYHKIYVENWESPYIRYAFEHGDMKHELGKSYPSQFTLAKGILHHHYTDKDYMLAWIEELPYMDDLMNYDLLISSKLFGWTKSHNSNWKTIDSCNNFWIHK